MPRPIVKTIFRWIWRLLVLAVMLLLIALCAALLCLPRIIEPRIQRELAKRGVENVHIAVQGVYWNSAAFGPITIHEGTETLTVESVRLVYHPEQLRRGHVEQIHIIGLACTVHHDNGAWRIVGEGTLRRLAAAFGMVSEAPAPASSALPDFCRRILVRNSQLLFVHGSEQATIPVAAEILLEPDRPVRAEALLRPFGAEVGVNAEVDVAEQSVSATIQWKRIQAGDWLPLAGVALPDGVTDLAATVDGATTITLRDWQLHGLKAEAVATGVRAEVDTHQARLRELRISVESGPDPSTAVVRCRGDHALLLCGAAITGPFAFAATWQDRTGIISADAVPFGVGADVRGTANLLATIRLDDTGKKPSAKAKIVLGQTSVAGIRIAAGTVELGGTLDDIEFDAAWELHPSAASYGLTAVTCTGRLNRTAIPTLTAVGNASVLPALALTEVAPTVKLGNALQPVEWALDTSKPKDQPWTGSCRLTVPEQSWNAVFAGGQAAVAVALTAELSGTSDAATATIGVTLRDGKCEHDTVRASFDTVRLTLGTASLPLPLPLPATEADRATAPAWHTVVNKLAISGKLEITGAEGHVGENLEGRDVALNLPFEWTAEHGFMTAAPGTLPGRIESGPLRIGPIEATAFHAACVVEGSTLRSEGTVQLTMPQVPIEFRKQVDWSDGIRAHIGYQSPQIALAGGDLPPRLATHLSGIVLSGEVRVEGEVTYDAAGPRAPVTFTLANGELRWDANNLLISGIDGGVAFTDILTLRSEPHQQVRFASAIASDVPVDGGHIVFQIESPESLFVERCKMNWCGGTVHSESFLFNPNRPEFDITLFAEQVDLVQALSLVKGFRGKGSGVLYGKLPISFQHGHFSYATGYLYSIPGREGRLQLESTGFLTAGVPTNAPAYSQLEQAERALQDFRVDVFRLDFTGRKAGEPRATLSLAGESLKPGMPPVKLDINFNGAIEEAINVGLRIGGF